MTKNELPEKEEIGPVGGLATIFRFGSVIAGTIGITMLFSNTGQEIVRATLEKTSFNPDVLDSARNLLLTSSLCYVLGGEFSEGYLLSSFHNTSLKFAGPMMRELGALRGLSAEQTQSLYARLEQSGNGVSLSDLNTRFEGLEGDLSDLQSDVRRFGASYEGFHQRDEGFQKDVSSRLRALEVEVKGLKSTEYKIVPLSASEPDTASSETTVSKPANNPYDASELPGSSGSGGRHSLFDDSTRRGGPYNVGPGGFADELQKRLAKRRRQK